MRGRIALLVILAVLMCGVVFETSTALAKSKAKPKATKVTKKLKSTTRVNRKTSGKKFVTKRTSARSTGHYNRAILTRSRSVDGSLLRVAQGHISDDDVIGEDMEVREAAIEALGSHSGTVVVMEPTTGRVLSMVNQKWAIGKPFKPCSTIKLVTSIAALNEGVADPDYPLGGDGINMINALAHSNNEYFQVLGSQIGFEQVVNYCHELGIGERTGINMEGESAGFVPSYKSPNEVPRMCSHGDDIGVTAMQLAVLTSAIANGGYIYQPQVLRNEKDQKNFQPIMVRKVDLLEKDRAKIVEGMLGAVNYGTARRSGVSALQVAGKTGSCNGEDSKLGLFASFTSPNNPEMVVVVISEGSSERGSEASVVAGKIYTKLSHRLGKFERPSVKPSERLNEGPNERPRRVNPLNDDAPVVKDTVSKN